MKKSLLIGIIIILVLAIVITIIVYQKNMNVKEPFAECNEHINKINDLKEQSNYCNEDSDCLISTDLIFFCNCYDLLNKNADLLKISNAIESYDYKNCMESSCAPCERIPQQSEIKCKNKKCIDTGINNLV